VRGGNRDKNNQELRAEGAESETVRGWGGWGWVCYLLQVGDRRVDKAGEIVKRSLN